MFCFLLLLMATIAICSWLSPPGSSLDRSAWQAFDSTLSMLSQGGGGDDDDDGGTPKRARRVAAHAPSTRGVTREPRRELPGAGPSRVATRRKRITPFQAKRVAARQQWRCATCGELLQEDFEVDHIVPLHRGGSFDNYIDSLQALHKRCHLLKNSLE